MKKVNGYINSHFDAVTALLEGIQKAQEALADAHTELREENGHLGMEHCEDCTVAAAFLQNEALVAQIRRGLTPEKPKARQAQRDSV